MDDLRSLFETLAADAPVVGDIDSAIATAAYRRRRRSRLVAVAAVAATVAVTLTIVGIGLNAQHTSPEPSGRLIGPRTWSSSLLDYQLTYPPGWRLTPATAPWTLDPTGGWPADSSRDVYQSPGRPALKITSQELPPGMTDRAWLRSYVRGQVRANGGSSGSQTCWPAARHWLSDRMAGRRYYLHGQNQYCAFTEAVTFVNGRAYVFTGFAGTIPGVFSTGRLAAFLRTVQFLPGPGTTTPSSSG
jgi:hypothetical protein